MVVGLCPFHFGIGKGLSYDVFQFRYAGFELFNLLVEATSQVFCTAPVQSSWLPRGSVGGVCHLLEQLLQFAKVLICGLHFAFSSPALFPSWAGTSIVMTESSSHNNP